MTSALRPASLRQNIIAMYALQGAGYLIPFFTLPFLVRALGADGYGLLAFSQAVVMFVVMFADSGFNRSATRSIAFHRADPVRVSEIYWSTQIVRLGLSLVGASTLAVLVLLFETWRSHWPLFLAQGLMLVGTLSLPVWYFNGLERMKNIAIFSMIARLASAAAIFALVRGPEDVLVAAICQASATLVSGLTVHFALLRHEMPWRRPDRLAIADTFKLGRTLFASEFVAGAAANSNVVLLGVFASKEAAGIYAAIEKLMRALASLAHPILLAYSPRVTRVYGASGAQARRMAWQLLWRMASVALLVAAVLMANAPFVLHVLFGEHLVEYDDALRAMSLWLFLNCINMGLAQFYFLAPGYFAALSRLLLLSVTVQIALGVGLTASFGLAGMVAAAVLTELSALAIGWRLLAGVDRMSGAVR